MSFHITEIYRSIIRIIGCVVLLIIFTNPLRCIAQSENITLKVTIIDESTGELTPARVHVKDSQDNTLKQLPSEAIAIMYGRNDRSERYGYQPDSSFYVDGNFSLELAKGSYTISISKGMEYVDQYHSINLNTGDLTLRYSMSRWVDMPSKGWYSADDHIHIRRSPRENPLILKWLEAEDVHVGSILQMGDLWTTYYSQYSFGKEGVYQDGDNLLTTGQEEPRTHEVGHTIALLADDFVRHKSEYYLYDQYFDDVHKLNGITGYAHQGISFNGSRGMTLDVLSGKVDFLELVQYCVEGGPLLTQNYYHYLDLGFKLTATAGSDFPWCGLGTRFGLENEPSWNARIGNVRFYTYLGESLTYDLWDKNLRAGHTFVTSGPMIDFRVNGKIPGSEINLNKKTKLKITASALGHISQVPLSRLEIIAHGKVIKTIEPKDKGQSVSALNIELNIPVDKGIWIAARCFAGPTQVAHTTPVYVTFKDQGFQNLKTFNHYLSLNEQYLKELETVLDSPSDNISRRAWTYKKGLKTRIEVTRKIIENLKNR